MQARQEARYFPWARPVRMVGARFCLLLALVVAVTGADALDPSDNLVIPGTRVGLITPGMTADVLELAYGKANVIRAEIPGAEGETMPGARLFAETDRELEILWDPRAEAEPRVFDIRIIGSAWRFENGLKPGLGLEAVEAINGKPFTVLGFGWDYGGYANFEGGALEGKVSLRFDPGDGDIPDALVGEQSLPSTDLRLRALGPRVEAPISVFMGLPDAEGAGDDAPDGG